ncbi:MAG TPA: diguanylate cyclase [Pilimelia sp.]|nr:diguanylate cyclase [Pilimelia sp.]
MTNPRDLGRSVLGDLFTDPLTGALARGRLDGCLDGAIARAQLTGGYCSVFVFDIDHFKTVNDAYGHARGDAVLRGIAERTMAVIRDVDLLVRYGGDEFVLVLPETAAAEAMRIAVRLVERISGEPFPGSPPLSLSISVGLATYPDDAPDRDGLLEVADRRNYLAKRRGRGRAVRDDVAVGGSGGSGRVLERDAALAVAHDFLIRIESQEPGALRVIGERGAGHSRFLAEVATLAGMRGFAVYHLDGAGNALVDGVAAVIGQAERVLVVADTDADAAKARELTSELAGAGGARVVGLLHAVHEPAGPDTPLPVLGTVVLGPLSASALHIWLRTTLRGEPTPALVQWLVRRSGGFVARAERELTRLADGGHLEQLGGGGWGVSAAALARAEQARRRLPAPVSSLVGRERDITRVTQVLVEHRLVTLVGAGGIGKTRLALAVAATVAEEFADGAAFVPLAEATTTDLVVSTLAGTLEVSETADEPLADTVIQAVTGLELLLILDNFEQVLSAGPFVADLLTAAPGVRVLATSRQRLRLSGEQVYTVAPLPVPDLERLPALPEDTAAVLAASPAVALFVARAREVVYGTTFTLAELRAVAQVCGRLDGLPLAIELAAANCDVLSPARILAQLSEHLELPAAGPRDLPARQRTLRATMDWSFALLDPDDRDLMTRLAVFAGGCPAEAIPAICLPADANPTVLTKRLAGLVDRNLLGTQDTPDGIRYTMLETIRTYAAERLASTADDGVAQRHAAYFATFAERADDGLGGPDLPAWHARVTREYPNLRAAFARGMADGDTVTAARIVLGVQRHWRQGWHVREGRDWHHRLLTTTSRPPLPDDMRAWVLYSAAFLAVMQDDYAAARPLGEESLRLGRHLADPELLASALNVVGLIDRATGDLDRARACFGECIAILEACGTGDRILAGALANLAYISVMADELDDAYEPLSRCAELNREAGFLRGLALNLMGLGSLQVDRGDAAGARPLLTEALDLNRQVDDVFAEVYIIHALGRLARLEGDPIEAYRHFATAIKQSHQLGERTATFETFISLADLLSTVDPARAARMLSAVEAARDRHGMPMTKYELRIRDATLRRIRTALTEPDLAAALASGHAMSLDDAVADALAVDPTSLA